LLGRVYLLINLSTSLPRPFSVLCCTTEQHPYSRPLVLPIVNTILEKYHRLWPVSDLNPPSLDCEGGVSATDEEDRRQDALAVLEAQPLRRGRSDAHASIKPLAWPSPTLPLVFWNLVFRVAHFHRSVLERILDPRFSSSSEIFMFYLPLAIDNQYVLTLWSA
jgi:hypothetical protein